MSVIVAKDESILTPTSRVAIMGCQIDNVSIEEAVSRIDCLIRSGLPHRYFAVNVHKIVAFRRTPELLRIANESDLVTADGKPIVWLSKLLGQPLKERVAGIDLMTRLLAQAEERQYRVYFFGATQESIESAVRAYKKRHPALNIVGVRHGYWTEPEEQEIVSNIRSSRPDVLFLGISSPAKEVFMARYTRDLGVPFVMGVGGSFDVGAGLTSRAPVRIQAWGLEWLWRIWQEPSRMLSRYFFDGMTFLLLVSKEIVVSRNRNI